MLVPWTSNQDWRQPIRRDLCGYVSDRFIPCPNPKPCPVHDKKAPRLSVYDPWESK
jgi:hypothetical protein